MIMIITGRMVDFCIHIMPCLHHHQQVHHHHQQEMVLKEFRGCCFFVANFEIILFHFVARAHKLTHIFSKKQIN